MRLQVPRGTGWPQLTTYLSTTHPLEGPREHLIAVFGLQQRILNVVVLPRGPDELTLAFNRRLPCSCLSDVPIPVVGLQSANKRSPCEIRQDTHTISVCGIQARTERHENRLE